MQAALVVFGLCKGIYDANIFASVYDVIPSHVRGTTAGLMNTTGWAAAALAGYPLGLAQDRYGRSAAIAATSAAYVLSGLLALWAVSLAGCRDSRTEEA
jgi:sugar phosphate permease